MRSVRWAVIALVAVLTACNPLDVDPVSPGPGFEEAKVQFQGPGGTWIEASAQGTEGYAIFAMALVRDADLTGPTDRPCAASGGAVVPCDDTGFDVRTPSQRILPADGTPQRLMTAWSGEVVDIWLVCVEETTQELVCPTDVRMQVRAVDATGVPVGNLSVAG